jgi:hypothetical protein
VEIISASRRTDVPAFHARWFLNRIRAGYCHWIQPFNGRVHRVSLAPRDVWGIVFWTRNPGQLLPELDALAEHSIVFQYTINGYGPPLESHNPATAVALRRFEELARRLGPDAVSWRYDPIVLSSEWDASYHARKFRELADRMQGMTRRCTFSFVDRYGKTVRNLAKMEASSGLRVLEPSRAERLALTSELAEIAAERGIRLRSCCDDSLVGGAVERSRCVDPEILAAVRGERPAVPSRPTRPDCGCARSVDVGAYDTCAFGCTYCYAVSGRAASLRRIAGADPEDSVLHRPRSLFGVDLEERAVAGLARSGAAN